jgi:hypothetical protein
MVFYRGCNQENYPMFVYGFPLAYRRQADHIQCRICPCPDVHSETTDCVVILDVVISDVGSIILSPKTPHTDPSINQLQIRIRPVACYWTNTVLLRSVYLPPELPLMYCITPICVFSFLLIENIWLVMYVNFFLPWSILHYDITYNIMWTLNTEIPPYLRRIILFICNRRTSETYGNQK